VISTIASPAVASDKRNIARLVVWMRHTGKCLNFKGEHRSEEADGNNRSDFHHSAPSSPVVA
jgi:hypothetical protein